MAIVDKEIGNGDWEKHPIGAGIAPDKIKL